MPVPLRSRGVGYSLALRLLLRLALSSLLSASRLGSLASRISLLLLRLARGVSLLLLKLTHLPGSIPVASRDFSVETIYLLHALLLRLFEFVILLSACPLRLSPFTKSVSASFLPFVALVLNFKLLVPRRVGNTLNAHRLRQVFPETRLLDIAADKNRRVPKFLRNARRQINLAARSPG